MTQLKNSIQTDQYRQLFNMPEGIYALSHSVGPLPIAAKKALNEEYFTKWSSLGGDAWPDWLGQIDLFCQSMATLINADANELCPQTNLASGFSAFLSAIAKLPENKNKRVILMHEDAFASMGFVVTALSHCYQLELVLLKGDPNDIDNWQQAFEQHKVLACLITHVHSNTSEKSDPSAVAKLCRRYSSYAMVDIAQSVGIVHVDVKQWQADAVFGSCVKWLCSGPGAGFMYVAEDLIRQLHPDPVGWFSHENPFEFDIRHYQAATNAKRFWGGTPSISPFVIANASIQVLSAIGLQNIVTHNRYLKQVLLSELPESKELEGILDNFERLGGSLCLKSNNALKTVDNLRKNKVRFDQREGIFRISLHIQNTIEEAKVIAHCFR